MGGRNTSTAEAAAESEGSDGGPLLIAGPRSECLGNSPDNESPDHLGAGTVGAHSSLSLCSGLEMQNSKRRWPCTGQRLNKVCKLHLQSGVSGAPLVLTGTKTSFLGMTFVHCNASAIS